MLVHVEYKTRHELGPYFKVCCFLRIKKLIKDRCDMRVQCVHNDLRASEVEVQLFAGCAELQAIAHDLRQMDHLLVEAGRCFFTYLVAVTYSALNMMRKFASRG